MMVALASVCACACASCARAQLEPGPADAAARAVPDALAADAAIPPMTTPADAALTSADASPPPDAAPPPIFTAMLYDGRAIPQSEGWHLRYTTRPKCGTCGWSRDPLQPIPFEAPPGEEPQAILWTRSNTNPIDQVYPNDSRKLVIDHALEPRATVEITIALDISSSIGPAAVAPRVTVDDAPGISHWEAGFSAIIAPLLVGPDGMPPPNTGGCHLIVAADGWGWADRTAWVALSDMSTIHQIVLRVDARGNASATIAGTTITRTGATLVGSVLAIGDLSNQAWNTGGTPALLASDVDVRLRTVTQTEPAGGVVVVVPQ
jgi:hypothetical protein